MFTARLPRFSGGNIVEGFQDVEAVLSVIGIHWVLQF
jgi:hypothetical protein